MIRVGDLDQQARHRDEEDLEVVAAGVAGVRAPAKSSGRRRCERPVGRAPAASSAADPAASGASAVGSSVEDNRASLGGCLGVIQSPPAGPVAGTGGGRPPVGCEPLPAISPEALDVPFRPHARRPRRRRRRRGRARPRRLLVVGRVRRRTTTTVPSTCDAVQGVADLSPPDQAPTPRRGPGHHRGRPVRRRVLGAGSSATSPATP